MKFLNFSSFCWSFLPSLLDPGPDPNTDPDLDPLTRLNPDPRSSTLLLGTEMANRAQKSKKTHVHKNTNVPVFYMALGLNDFEAGKSITKAIVRVGP
jgi:hypothetical protein